MKKRLIIASLIGMIFLTGCGWIGNHGNEEKIRAEIRITKDRLEVLLAEEADEAKKAKEENQNSPSEDQSEKVKKDTSSKTTNKESNESSNSSSSESKSTSKSGSSSDTSSSNAKKTASDSSSNNAESKSSTTSNSSSSNSSSSGIGSSSNANNATNSNQSSGSSTTSNKTTSSTNNTTSNNKGVTSGSASSSSSVNTSSTSNTSSTEKAAAKKREEERKEEIKKLLEKLDNLKEALDKKSGNTTSSSPAPTCSFLGKTFLEGQSKFYYKSEKVPFGESCQKKERKCEKGVMIGNTDYKYETCSVEINVSNSKKTNPSTNGSGSISSSTNNSNSATAPKHCQLNGITIEDGTSKNFYSLETVTGYQECSTYEAPRSCKNGVLYGDSIFKYPSCTKVFAPFGPSSGSTSGSGSTSSGSSTAPAPTITFKDCLLDSLSVAHETSASFYIKNQMNAGETCANHSIDRYCFDGSLSGNIDYKYSNCQESPVILFDVNDSNNNTIEPNTVYDGSCTLDGVKIANRSTHPFYSKEVAFFEDSPLGCAGIMIERTCNNGTLSGSNDYKYASCSLPTVSQEKDCSLDGINLASGEFHSFYSTQKTPSGEACSNFEQSRTCKDGILSGSSDYKYSTCIKGEVISLPPTETLEPLDPMVELEPVEPVEPIENSIIDFPFIDFNF